MEALKLYFIRAQLFLWYRLTCEDFWEWKGKAAGLMEQDMRGREFVVGVERENILEVNMNTSLMNKRSFNIPL